MNDVFTTIQTVLLILAGAATISAGLRAISHFLNPFTDLKKRVKSNEDKLKRDYETLQDHTDLIRSVEEMNCMQLKALMKIINHLITNNDIEKLKEEKSEIEMYLIQNGKAHK